jgi:hypothetical protein
VKKNSQRIGTYFTLSEEEMANSSASRDSLAFHLLRTGSGRRTLTTQFVKPGFIDARYTIEAEN